MTIVKTDRYNEVLLYRDRYGKFFITHGNRRTIRMTMTEALRRFDLDTNTIGLQPNDVFPQT